MCPQALRAMQFTTSEVEMLANSEVEGNQRNWQSCLRGQLAQSYKRAARQALGLANMCRPPSILPWHPKGIKLSIPLHLSRAHAVFSSLRVPWCVNQQPLLSACVYTSPCSWCVQQHNWIFSNMQSGKSCLWIIFHILFASQRPFRWHLVDIQVSSRGLRWDTV